MLLNTVTHMVYIGATSKTLRERWREHLRGAKEHGSRSKLATALREWPEEMWDQIVLCNCYSMEQLSEAERTWQFSCYAFDEGVGYNENHSTYTTTMNASKKSAEVLTMEVRKNSPLAGLTPEQRREYFRQAGKRGALVASTRDNIGRPKKAKQQLF